MAFPPCLAGVAVAAEEEGHGGEAATAGQDGLNGLDTQLLCTALERKESLAAAYRIIQGRETLHAHVRA